VPVLPVGAFIGLVGFTALACLMVLFDMRYPYYNRNRLQVIILYTAQRKS